jgi:hypothetical protein
MPYVFFLFIYVVKKQTHRNIGLTQKAHRVSIQLDSSLDI